MVDKTNLSRKTPIPKELDIGKLYDIVMSSQN